MRRSQPSISSRLRDGLRLGLSKHSSGGRAASGGWDGWADGWVDEHCVVRMKARGQACGPGSLPTPRPLQPLHSPRPGRPSQPQRAVLSPQAPSTALPPSDRCQWRCSPLCLLGGGHEQFDKGAQSEGKAGAAHVQKSPSPVVSSVPSPSACRLPPSITIGQAKRRALAACGQGE